MSLSEAAKVYAAAVEAKNAHIRAGGAAKGVAWLALTSRLNHTRQALLRSAKHHGSVALQADRRIVREARP